MVQISRDVKFLQRISDRPSDLADDFHSEERHLRDNSKPADGTNTPRSPHELSNEIQLIGSRNQPDDRTDSISNLEEKESDEEGEEEELPSVGQPQEARRGPGKPRKVLTGRPGRPQKKITLLNASKPTWDP